MNIGRRIREFREKQGMNQSELAEKSGLTPGAISQIENGKRANPTEDTLHKIAKALNTTYEMLTLTNREEDKVTVKKSPSYRKRSEGSVTIKIDNMSCVIGTTFFPPEREERDETFNITTFISTRFLFEQALENAITEVLFENKDELMNKFYANLDMVRDSMKSRLDLVTKVMDGVASNEYRVEFKNKQEGEDS